MSVSVLHNGEMSIRIYGALLHRGRMSGLLSGVLAVDGFVFVLEFKFTHSVNTQWHDYAIGHFSIELTMLTVLKY